MAKKFSPDEYADVSTLGKRIEYLINTNYDGIDQNKLANLIGIPKNTLIRTIKDEHELGINKIVKISQIFGCDLHWLIIGWTYEEQKEINKILKSNIPREEKICSIQNIRPGDIPTYEELEEFNKLLLEGWLEQTRKIEAKKVPFRLHVNEPSPESLPSDVREITKNVSQLNKEDRQLILKLINSLLKKEG